MWHANGFRSLARASIIFMLLLSSACVAAENALGIKAVRSILDVYLSVEYQADTAYNREQLIKFTPSRRAFLESKTEPGVGLYDLYINTGEPVFVVDVYKIVEIKVNGRRATAKISYNRLGRIMNGMGTVNTALIPDKKDNDLVTLNLVFENRQWWVLDPPPPRISRGQLILDYESELKWYEDRKNELGKLPVHQQEAYDKKSSALRLLKNLP